jgi:hypothetical protein
MECGIHNEEFMLNDRVKRHILGTIFKIVLLSKLTKRLTGCRKQDVKKKIQHFLVILLSLKP